MKINITLSDKELKEVALKQKKSIEEVANDYKHIIKDLEYSNKKLNEIIESSAYVRFPNNFSLHGYGDRKSVV